MGIYLLNFLVYAMAMVGILFVCLMVFKKTMLNNRFSQNNKNLNVETSLNLGPRKTLYVINAGDEKFLIASDAERTTFLSKLNSQPTNQFSQHNGAQQQETFNRQQNRITETRNIDYSEVMSAINKNNTQKKSPMMREIMQKLNK